MKKVFFLMALAFMALMNVNAQDVQLATLQKADGTQVFYGADAFKEAMEAAENGNTISLGAGAYNAANITKAVTIYGSGYEIAISETEQKYSTRLVGDFYIALDSVDNQPVKGLYLEGIYSNNRIMLKKHLEGASFVKCRFDTFDFWKDGANMMTSKDIQFLHCRFAQWLEPGDSQNMSVNNCIIAWLGRNKDTSTIIINNSVISSTVKTFRGVLKNSIIGYVNNSDNDLHYVNGSNQAPIHPNSSIYNCVFEWSGSLDDVTTKIESVAGIETTTLFGEHGTGYKDEEMYELTDEAKTTYLGTDGKEIGLYGGATPFSPILTIPRVVKKDIAAQTADGKLKVNIKVETGDSSF